MLKHDPHGNTATLHAGVALKEARVAVILLHGRGASAQSILGLAQPLAADGVAFLAPQAVGNSWYPQRFIAPLEANEPWLTSALGVATRLVDEAGRAGVPRERVVVGGFSQGACLALEWALRSGGPLGGVFALSGGVIGPPGGTRSLDRDLAGTRVFIGCGDEDAHIPVASVRESIAVLHARGAEVTDRIYPSMDHTIVADEIDQVAALICAADGASR